MASSDLESKYFLKLLIYSFPGKPIRNTLLNGHFFGNGEFLPCFLSRWTSCNPEVLLVPHGTCKLEITREFPKRLPCNPIVPLSYPEIWENSEKRQFMHIFLLTLNRLWTVSTVAGVIKNVRLLYYQSKDFSTQKMVIFSNFEQLVIFFGI